MKIVVLDGHTLNPGDLSWDDLKELGNCTIYDRTPAGLVEERAANAEVVLTNKTPLPGAVLDRLEALRYVGVLATGYNVVDIDAARKRKIIVTNVPDYGTHSVAQFTFALLLELVNRTGAHAEAVREGHWERCPDFCFWNFPLVELHGARFGVVGFGKIGRAVAALAHAFGMQVVVHSRSRPRELPTTYELAGIDALFETSDVISLHCPLTPETKHLVNSARLARMKKTAYLLNTARGPLIDEPALASALNEERIAGAGLDVLAVEPPHSDNPLLRAKNCIITPHIAWATKAARQRLMGIAVENVRSFLAGSPRNVVS